MNYLTTDRLILRDWQERDKEPFARMNADAEVMRYFPNVLSSADSDIMMEAIQSRIEENHYGFFAVEHRQTGAFIGFIGLNSPKIDYPFNPCIEVGWRLDKAYWGYGLATEGALACLDFGFDKCGFDKIVSFTASTNLPSQRVMQKIGMRFVYEFDHPTIPSISPLFKHVLYQITQSQFY
ncbi:MULTISPECIES: GNAT family N-acetyltransferase [unclassified Acinetobacter]|uniref:GNAT family N-acetyltransferase n=1 Tax=unclassified Acinetobacter TaxID=196816 RepID=UPI0035BA2B76